MNTFNFRRDINGLRSWAVIAVILYHFGIPGFGGGYVGVDVFFVISGYLMTGIIAAGLNDKAGSFSLPSFYIARAKRLLPALAALCSVLLLLGWFYLPQADYNTLTTHILSAIGFYSNFQFLSEAGYFDAASYDKLLLHTWSLSVEWQFYLILPIILKIVWRISPRQRSLATSILLLSMSSLAICIYTSEVDRSSAFYLFHTRAWEMLAGGLVFFMRRKAPTSEINGRLLEASGAVLIILSMTFFDSTTNWPSWRALAPVIGTMLIIAAARQDSVLTDSRPAQWIGDCSYSLYLWHWPIVATMASFELLGNPIAIVAGLILTFFIGRLSYTHIEKGARRKTVNSSTTKSLSLILIALIAIAAPSLIIKHLEGAPNRSFATKVGLILEQAENKNPRLEECRTPGRQPFTKCHYGGENLGVIVLGDSHVPPIIRAIEKSLPKELYALDLSISGCLTIRNINIVTAPKSRCSELIENALDISKAAPHDIPIVIINRASAYIFGPNEPDRKAEIEQPAVYITKMYSERTQEYLDEIREGIISTACEFAKNRTVYMMKPIPEMKLDVPKTMARRAMIPGKETDVFISIDEYKERNAFVLNAQEEARDRCGIVILDPTPYLCDKGRCSGSKDELPIYFDDDHLNERGADQIVPMFRSMMTPSALPGAKISKE